MVVQEAQGPLGDILWWKSVISTLILLVIQDEGHLICSKLSPNLFKLSIVIC